MAILSGSQHGPVRAIVFDMDGVLIDSEVIWRRVRAEYAAELGHTWTEADQMDLLGRSTPDWSARMRLRLHIEHLSAAELAEDVVARVLQAFRQDLPQRTGAATALRTLAAHYPLALASGSPRSLVECALRSTGFDQYFQSVLTGDDVRQGKPHPEIYLRSLAALQSPARQTLGIEDAPNGLLALRAAGMRAIAAPCPEFPLDADSLALADHHIAAMTELTLALVQSL